jgi:hypothetical protein
LDTCHTELAAGDAAAWLTGRLERTCGDLGTTVRPVAERLLGHRLRA